MYTTHSKQDEDSELHDLILVALADWPHQSSTCRTLGTICFLILLCFFLSPPAWVVVPLRNLVDAALEGRGLYQCTMVNGGCGWQQLCLGLRARTRIAAVTDVLGASGAWDSRVVALGIQVGDAHCLREDGGEQLGRDSVGGAALWDDARVERKLV
jgi:hypothetical protein